MKILLTDAFGISYLRNIRNGGPLIILIIYLNKFFIIKVSSFFTRRVLRFLEVRECPVQKKFLNSHL